MRNRHRKIKRYVEGNNLGQHFFCHTNPNNEIPHIFNITTPKDFLIQIIYGYVKPGFKHVGTHIIFDIKIDGKFTRKYKLLAGGHKTAPPFSIT